MRAKPTSVRLHDRYSGGIVFLTVRDGVVVGAMGSDPKRYVGMPIAIAKHYARHGGVQHTVAAKVYEKGRRVTVLNAHGDVIGDGHVYTGDNYPDPNEHTTWVKVTRDGETSTMEYPTPQLRAR